MAMLEYIGVFVAIHFFIFIHYWRRNKDAPMPNWPIIGMLLAVLRNLSNIHDYATSVLKHYGGTIRFEGPWLTNMNFVLTSDPINVHHITSKNFGNYEKGSYFHEIFEVLGDGIFNSDSQIWKQERARLHSLFKRRSFEIFFQQTIQKKLENCLLPFLDHASKAGTLVDLQDTFQRFTFDNICSIVFDPNCLPNKFVDFSDIAYEKAFNEVEEVLMHRYIIPKCLWKLQKWLQIGPEKKFTEALKTFEQFLHECITSKREEQKRCSNSEEVDESQFHMLKALMDEGGKEQIDDKYMRDTAVNLLAAGKDTISAGLCWFFWLVATHPLVEAKILEEIRDNFPTKEEILSTSGVEVLSKLVYLHGAICESLRLFPPVPFAHKCAIKSDTLPSGDRISANTMVIYSLYSMGRMEQTWGEDCLKFKPERWISEKGGNVHVPSYKFIAFNAGPRSCLGKDMSFIEMKMVAAALLWKFHIQVVEGHPVSPSVSVALHMKHGLKVNVTKRCIRWKQLVFGHSK